MASIAAGESLLRPVILAPRLRWMWRDTMALTGLPMAPVSMPVLVVDDYNTMIRIIRNLLRQIGFQDVDDANDGAAALARMREKKYG